MDDVAETSKTPARRPVIVGVDGSDPSLAAVDLAADEAALRGAPLEVVHAFNPPVLASVGGAPPDLPPVGPAADLTEPALRERAEELLHEAADRVRRRHPALAMISRRHDGAPAEVLTDASHHASLLVLGHRGLGGFTELLVGSVSIQVVNHATCPVIVVRGSATAAGPVVVGVDGSDGSHRAAEFAAETAVWYGASLTVLYAWPHDPGWAPAQAQAGEPPPAVPDSVTELVVELTERHPELSVTPVVRRGQATHETLVDASRNARLVVVGARGIGGFRGLLLGSVSQALVHHSECPVAVVGPDAPPD